MSSEGESIAMMLQATLFDLKEGTAQRDKGVNTALFAPGMDVWTLRAEKAVQHLLSQGRTFTSDDVIEAVGLPRLESAPNRNNAVGALFQSLAKRGVIKKVGYAKTRRAIGHARVVTVWGKR